MDRAAFDLYLGAFGGFQPDLVVGQLAHQFRKFARGDCQNTRLLDGALDL